MTNIEAPIGEINDVCVVKNSGLIFMALDSPRIPSFFVPSLGPAPQWCSFLENLTVCLTLLHSLTYEYLDGVFYSYFKVRIVLNF